MLASWRYLRATGRRIPSLLCPFNLRFRHWGILPATSAIMVLAAKRCYSQPMQMESKCPLYGDVVSQLRVECVSSSDWKADFQRQIFPNVS